MPLGSLASCSSDAPSGGGGAGNDEDERDIEGACFLARCSTGVLPGRLPVSIRRPPLPSEGNDAGFVRMYPRPSGYRHIMESPLGSFLCPPGYAGPSGLRALARETSAVSEAARFVRRTAVQRLHRRKAPYGSSASEDGLDPVVLVPGFLAGDGAMTLM